MNDLADQIADYERKYPHVPCDSPPGTRVTFHGHGGYPNDRDQAHKVLSVGAVYVLAGSVVGNWLSTFYLEGVEGGFNSAMFSPEGWTPPQ